MSKNTNISELINYISYDGSGNVVFTTVSAATTNTDKFLVSDAGVLKFRTAAQLLSDIGAQASGSYQAALSGTGFVKISGTTISYDNSTYATQTYVGTAISNLVDSSPATLDTLNELAAALGDDPNFATTVATSIGTKQPQLNGTGFVKVTGTTVSYDNSTYLTTGTASSTYVPYTGATSDVNIGINIFKSNYILLEGDASAGGYIGFKQKSGAQGAGLGYSSIAAQGLNKFYFRAYQTGADVKYFNFDLSSITSLTDRTYTLPDASGTLALTSNLSSYLPLAGGTLTGPLNGTNAIFSGGGNTLVLKKGTGSPAIALAGTSEEATGLIEGVSGGGIKFYTSTGTLSSPSWSSKLLITPTEGIKFGANAVSIIGTEGANGYHYMYAGGTPKIYLEAAGVVAFLNTGGTFVGTTTKWNGENFGVQTSNSAGWSTIPSIMRLTNYISGGVTKITFTDSNIIDGWFGMVPVSGNSYFAMGFSGYTEQGFKVYQGGSVSINASSIGYANTKLQVNGNSSTDENNTTVFIQHSFGGSNGFGLAISRNASSAAALSLGADTSNNGIISANNTNLRLGKNTSGTFYEYLNINTNGNSVFSGNVLPVSDAVYTLGSPSFRWNHVYTTDLHLSNEGKQNIVDGTWGDWTLQEGENDIFMLNNRSGEKFKMKLEKV